jgi:hypothetical protein
MEKEIEGIKVELNLPYPIGTKLYWLYKDKIIHSEVVRYISFDLGLSNSVKIDMKRPDGITEMLPTGKVFLNKEDLIRHISE